MLVCVEVDVVVVDVLVVVVAVVVVVVMVVVVVVVAVVVSVALSRQIHHPLAAPPAAVPCGIQLMASFVRVSPAGVNDPLNAFPLTYSTSLLYSVKKPHTLIFTPAGPKIAHALSSPVGYAPG